MTEELWRNALKQELSYLRVLEGSFQAGPREIAKAKHRIDRIWKQGRPEWRAKGHA